MNAKLFLKVVLIILVLVLVVLISMHNTQSVTFFLPPIPKFPEKVQTPAAIMYVAFFAVGFLTGALLFGGGKKGGGSRPASGGK